MSSLDKPSKISEASSALENLRHGLRYRPEIDGLRAVAVIPVIFFHAGFSLFSGGFVGVDIFFVISGYLITGLIIAEKQAGSFSIRNFYERRARRILPALYLVTLICVPFALLWMSPEQLRAFGKSVVGVVFFVSNIVFWSQSGYFSPAADLKPLLHTWSLGIEEQYYLVFPLFIILFWRFGLRSIALLILLSIIPSLILAQVGSLRWPEATFYLIFSRGWELAIGALVAIYMLNPIAVRPALRELLGLLGLGLLCFAVFFYSASTPYPGLYALAPTIGTAAIILFATPHTIVGRALSLKLFVGIGLISYSAYLWHQPLFAFYRLVHIDRPSTGMLVALIIVCFLLAYVTWLFVETPARHKLSGTPLAASAAFASALVAGVGVIAASGYVGRSFTPVQIAQMSPVNGNNDRKLKNCPPVSDSSFGFHACSQHPQLKRKAVLYGDSHAGAVYAELSKELSVHGIDLVLLRNSTKLIFICEDLPGSFRYGRYTPAMKDWCAARTREIASISNDLGAEHLFVSLRYTFRLFPATGAVDSLEYDNGEGGVGDERYRRYFVLDRDNEISFDPKDKFVTTRDAFRSLIDAFSGKTTFVGPVPEVGWRVENLNRSHILLFGRVQPTISTDYERFKSRNRLANDILEAVEGYNNALVVQPSDIFCDRLADKRCVAQIDSVPLYSDDDHLSLEGAKLLSRYIVERLRERNAISPSDDVLPRPQSR